MPAATRRAQIGGQLGIIDRQVCFIDYNFLGGKPSFVADFMGTHARRTGLQGFGWSVASWHVARVILSWYTIQCR